MSDILKSAKRFREKYRTLILCTADGPSEHYIRIADASLVPLLIERLVELEEESNNSARTIKRLEKLLAGATSAPSELERLSRS